MQKINNIELPYSTESMSESGRALKLVRVDRKGIEALTTFEHDWSKEGMIHQYHDYEAKNLCTYTQIESIIYNLNTNITKLQGVSTAGISLRHKYQKEKFLVAVHKIEDIEKILERSLGPISVWFDKYKYSSRFMGKIMIMWDTNGLILEQNLPLINKCYY